MRRSLARLRHRRTLPDVDLPLREADAPAPLVSIIVATFNRSNVLKIALTSIRAQTFTDWEVLVVGDCCTDDTEDVVRSLGDGRIRFVNLPQNLGDQSGPNSVGIRRARGRYLAWLNHDDLWFPDHLEVLVRELETSRADLMVAPHFRVLELAETSTGISGELQAPEPQRPLRMSRGDVFLVSGWLMRRTLAHRLGDWRSARTVRYASSQQYLYRAWSAGARIVPGSSRSVVVMPSIAHKDAYATRRDAEHVIAARLMSSGDRRALEALKIPGSDVLISPVIELPVSNRQRNAVGAWIIRHRARFFRLTSPVVVRLGMAPWEYAAALVGFPVGGLNARLRDERGLPAQSAQRKSI